MRQTDYTARVLTAEAGHYLTQKADMAPADRTVSKEIWLAATDDPDNWREITQSEAQTINEEKRLAVEAAMLSERQDSPGEGDVCTPS